MLRTQTISVLAPETWEDQNDTYLLSLYKKARPEIKSLLVLCMTDASSTYHHWRVYAGSPSGVQIQFNPQAFQAWVDTQPHPNMRFEKVDYPPVKRFESGRFSTDKFPFLKRRAFRDEDEYRLIVEDYKTEGLRVYTLPFDLTIIEEIKLSPWLPESLVETVKQTLAEAYSGPEGGWERIKVRRTSLLANPKVMRDLTT